jgi:hypothetical protein
VAQAGILAGADGVLDAGVDPVGSVYVSSLPQPAFRLRRPVRDPVGAENPVTSCSLGIFANQPAEPVPAQNANTGHFSRRLDAPGGRVLLQ